MLLRPRNWLSCQHQRQSNLPGSDRGTPLLQRPQRRHRQRSNHNLLHRYQTSLSSYCKIVSFTRFRLKLPRLLHQTKTPRQSLEYPQRSPRHSHHRQSRLSQTILAHLQFLTTYGPLCVYSISFHLGLTSITRYVRNARKYCLRPSNGNLMT
jgi:hypothetical protein